MSDAIVRRVAVLIKRQMESVNDNGEHPVTLELVDIIRNHGSDVVLDNIKTNLKHGNVGVQIRALSILNQCVLNSGPDVAVAISTEKWAERFYSVAKTTESTLLRDRIIRQLLLWYNKYRTNGLEQCLGRFSQSKGMKDDFLRVSRELDARQGSAGSSRTPPGSPSYVDPTGQGNRQRAVSSRTITETAAARHRDAILSEAAAQTRQVARTQQQQQPMQRSTDGDRSAVLSNLETFIMDAQGDLASLEYGLSHPEMLDKTTARDCKKHKVQVGRILQLDVETPPQYTEALMRLLENLSNALEVYEMFSGEDLGEGGINRFQSFGTLPGRRFLDSASERSTAMSNATAARQDESTSSVPAQQDSDDEGMPQRARSGFEVDAAAVQASQEALRLVEQERAELADARKQLSEVMAQNEELQSKYKDAKTKNKKALAMLTESHAQIEELESQLEHLQGGAEASGGNAAPQRTQVVEKVVVQRPTVSRDIMQRIRHDIFVVKEDLRRTKTETLADWRRDYNMMSAQIQGAVAGIVGAAQRERANDSKALQWAQDLYKKEMKLRKQYYNQIQELKGNIRVYCRVRPMSEKELSNGHTSIVEFPSEDELRLVDPSNGGRVRVFEFDAVFSPETSQTKVFEDTSPLIDSVVDGFNVCIFAYGQTGSGKTFTMNGPSSDKGINRRALDRLFHIIEERKESEESTVHVSVLEIYCEQIRDLLVSKADAARLTYDVKTGGPYGNYVTNLVEVEVKSSTEIDEVMDRAASNRSEGRTDMNAHSSRSHMILYSIVRTRNLHTGVQSYGKLSLVDLAGSERLDKSGSEGQAAKEAVAINKSLSALGDVIAGLSNSGQKHIPFRNSILTFLLQDSMAGQAKVLMFCNISPASYNSSESTSSLQFATRARGVSLGQAKKNVIAN